MANKPVSIEFVADVAKYLREVKKMDVATEDIADALVATTNSADDLERKLSKAMKDSAQDTEVLERALKDIPKATDNIADDAKKDFDKFGDAARDAGDDAGQEMGQEFKQNLGESLASGDLSTIVQDTAGGLVSGLSGPLAVAAAGVAGIAAVGFAEIQKQVQVVEGFIDSLGESIRSLYTQGVKTQDALTQLEAFNAFLEEQSETVRGLKDDFENTGIASKDYLTAIFEGGPALQAQRDELNGILDTLTAQSNTAEGLTLEQLEQNAAAQELLKYLDRQSQQQGIINQDMDTISTASREFAEHLGLADLNADGIVNEMDVLDAAVGRVSGSVNGLKRELADMDNLVVSPEIRILQTQHGAAGGGIYGSGSGSAG